MEQEEIKVVKSKWPSENGLDQKLKSKVVNTKVFITVDHNLWLLTPYIVAMGLETEGIHARRNKNYANKKNYLLSLSVTHHIRMMFSSKMT